ncbi:hypothetical protein JDV02_006840 [Purpureocillium takamizusanense]|uniref:G-patch domain-containing protein n=1 Tax=Purpureocillium takamizusanense TaxID=2060973 RepID=A0A9Q8QJ74_9HYPO|nr:uncharacterized protein JDV02_006840 [Purpureocillium takamizusanense]UNI20783.1 hypothetical protein JDV02_006840 [Purpureocillium takamizusanense]
MADPPPPAPASRGVLSLYDNIEDPNDPNPAATISAAPVVYRQDQPASAEAKKPANPALLFQPQIRRPQPKQAKGFKGGFPPKVIPTGAASSTAPPVASKTTLADWAPTEEDEWMYGTGEKRQRGGRKNKKKKQQQDARQETNWEGFYDVSKPTSIDEYIKGDEKVGEALDWREFVLQRGGRRRWSESTSDEDHSTGMPSQFAPPPSDSFPLLAGSPPKPPPSDQTGEDVFSRRAVMASSQYQPSRSLSPAPPAALAPPPPPPQFVQETPPPPPTDGAVISRAPIRYDIQQPPATDDRGLGASSSSMFGLDEGNAEQQPKSTRPGQAGFAQRLMSKYGWTEGAGLGASESGITNPLRVQVEKRRKKADADGGGWAEPGGKGKILGGKRKDEEGKFGRMSEVIVLRNMLENMPDLESEISNGLGQEIGEECGEKYGRVERLYIDQDARQVFIKFTDQVSALRAVNELDGRIFNGNTIVPNFYDVEKFERGVYTAK